MTTTAGADAPVNAFFAAAESARREAEGHGRHDRTSRDDCRAAPQPAFHGPALVPILIPAFAHVVDPDDVRPPLGTITCWDSGLTGVPMPSPRWSLDDYTARGEIRHFHDDTHVTAFSAAGAMLNLYDMAARHAVFWTRDATGVPYYERGAPLRTQLGGASPVTNV